jgi:hypothetical protein
VVVVVEVEELGDGAAIRLREARGLTGRSGRYVPLEGEQTVVVRGLGARLAARRLLAAQAVRCTSPEMPARPDDCESSGTEANAA